MSQNYTSKDHFPTWYKSIELALTKDILEKRLSSIEDLIEFEDIEFWLDVVRLAYGMDIKSVSNRSDFVDIFKEKDLTFPIQSNDNIVKVLAQISLCFLFESESSVGYKIGLAVINTNFFEQHPSTSVPFYIMARKHIEKEHFSNFADLDEVANSLKEKENSFEDDEEEEEVLEYEDNVNLIKIVNYLNSENKKLKEETNILWWLFGQYSTSNKAYFSEVALPKMIFACAYELLQISEHSAYVASAKHLLHKVLIICNGNKPKLKNYSLFDSISAMSNDIKEKVIKLGHQEELTPFLYSLHLEQTLGDVDLWKGAFNKKLGKGLIDKSYNAEELAFQFYTEISFIKSF
ncbi:GTPase-associated system all-helical protein GASH [Flavobacterium sp. C3NV]|uniref:GTPase-associated system all-helical protein GASH n=1 Tax=Flavobacterium sp. C3NV TaxID=3393358 RepID=UPI003990055E